MEQVFAILTGIIFCTFFSCFMFAVMKKKRRRLKAQQRMYEQIYNNLVQKDPELRFKNKKQLIENIEFQLRNMVDSIYISDDDEYWDNRK